MMKRRWKALLVSVGSLAVIASVPAATPAAGPRPEAPNAPATISFQGREIPNSLDEILNPKHTAVIVHEMINEFLSTGGSLDKQGRGYDPAQMATFLPRIQKLLATAREKKVRVIYVRYTSHADGSTFSDAIRRNQLSRGEPPPREHIEGEWGWQVIDAVKPKPEDLVLRKYRPDAFYGTVLDSILRWNGIKTIVMVGVGAAVGVIPTVMTASNLGYFTVAVSDGILSAEQKRTDDAMTYIGDHAILKTHAEVIDTWNRSAARPFGIVVPKASAEGGEPATVDFEGRELPMSIEEILNPQHTALLVHEMLNAFISPAGASDKGAGRYDPVRMARIVPSIQKLLATARAQKVRVVYVRSTSLPDGITSSDPQIQSMSGPRPGRPWPAVPLEGTWGWEIIDAVKPTPGDVVLPKYRPDAFFGTILDPVLRWNGIKTIVLVGIDGEVGGLSTLMAANYRGYFRVAISDGILTSDPARMESGMAFIGNQAVLKTHDEVVGIWTRHRPRPTS